MNRRTRLLLVGLFFLPAAARAQVPADKALSTFRVADGLEIALWASEPMFVNPTCIDIDHRGRVWVCESVNYRTHLRKKPLNRAEGDRIVVLEDSDGDGKADKATTFYQAPDLLAPLGIAIAPDPDGKGCKVYVCHSPHIYLFEDKDGDLKADDKPKVLLTGFKGYDHDHGVHGILIGPDGKLYFSVGDQGVDGLKDRNGKVWKTNQTDCRAGTIWRCDLDGANLEFIAHNFRNQYEPCVDSFGNIFVSDNDDDGNQQTRICYVMPGGNYGYHPRGQGQSHWHEEQPGVVPKILRTYFGSPTGMCVYEGTLLPKRYQGYSLHTDAGPRHLRCYRTTPDGAGFAVEREDMVTSSDNWFRPSDVCVAPDGSVFIADWYDPGVGGHGMGDTTRGRIFRVTPQGHKGYQVPKVEVESKEGVVQALQSPNLAARSMAITRVQDIKRRHVPVGAERPAEPKRLSKPEDEIVTGVSQAARQKNNPYLQARALGLCAFLNCPPTIPAFAAEPRQALLDPFIPLDANLLILWLRLMKESSWEPRRAQENKQDTNGLAEVLADKERPLDRQLLLKVARPGGRRELLLLLRDMTPETGKPWIIEAAKMYDGKDRFYLAALGIAVGADPKRRDVILADFDKHFPEWDDKVADLVWELRPPQAVGLLRDRVADAKFTPAQRGRMIDVLATSDDKDAGKLLLDVLKTGVPTEVRDKVIENLTLFLPGKWRDLRQSKELAAAVDELMNKADTRGTGLALMAAAEMTGAVGKINDIAKDDKQPAELRAAAVQTLGSLPTAESAAALDAMLRAEPASLRLEAIKALGRLAEPQAKRPSTDPALKSLRQLVTGKDVERSLSQAALVALSGSREGTEWLLDAGKKDQIPEGLRADAGRVLRNSPYPDLRNRALVDFPTVKLDPKKLPRVADLVARTGDEARGKQLLAASGNNNMQCLKCHAVRGAGGAIGPDLSVIGKKASRENLFESILEPNKAIADQFVTWVVETKKGVSVSGLLVEETPTALVIRDANGKDTRIDPKDVDSRTKSLTSLMPGDLLAYMTEDEVVDMVAYLLSLKTPALAFDSWHVAGPFDNGEADAGLDKAFPPEKGIDLKATYDGKSGKVGWRVVKPNAQGYVDLKEFLGADSANAVSYLYREVESPADQEVTVLLGTDDGAKLWVNGGLVHTGRQHRAAQPEQDTLKVKLKKGANKVLLKINNGDGPHGFYFTLLAEQELKPVAAK